MQNSHIDNCIGEKIDQICATTKLNLESETLDKNLHNALLELNEAKTFGSNNTLLHLVCGLRHSAWLKQLIQREPKWKSVKNTVGQTPTEAFCKYICIPCTEEGENCISHKNTMTEIQTHFIQSNLKCPQCKEEGENCICISYKNTLGQTPTDFLYTILKCPQCKKGGEQCLKVWSEVSEKWAELLISYDLKGLTKYKTGPNDLYPLTEILKNYPLLSTKFLEQLSRNVNFSKNDFSSRIDRNNTQVKLDFSTLLPYKKASEEDAKGEKIEGPKPKVEVEMELLHQILEIKPKNSNIREQIVSHPLISAFIERKWKKFTRFAWISVIFYFVLAITMSIYLIDLQLAKCRIRVDKSRVSKYNYDSRTRSVFGILFSTFTHPPPFELNTRATKNMETCSPALFDSSFCLSLVVLVMLTIVLTLEGIEWYQSGKKYWSSLTNYLQIGFFLLGIVAWIPPVLIHQAVSSKTFMYYQFQFAAWAILSVWSLLLIQISKFAARAEYLDMLFKVLKSIFGAFLTFICILLGFTLCNMLLFSNMDSTKTFPRAILKTLTSLSGEYSFQETLYHGPIETECEKFAAEFYPMTNETDDYSFTFDKDDSLFANCSFNITDESTYTIKIYQDEVESNKEKKVERNVCNGNGTIEQLTNKRNPGIKVEFKCQGTLKFREGLANIQDQSIKLTRENSSKATIRCLDKDTITTNQFVLFPLSAHLFYILFVLVCAIALFNLLIGLSVDDIQEIRRNAQIKSKIRMVEEIFYMEKVIRQIPFTSYFKHKISLDLSSVITELEKCIGGEKPRNAFVKTCLKMIKCHWMNICKKLPEFEFQESYEIYPHNPRDTTLSEDTKFQAFLMAKRNLNVKETFGNSEFCPTHKTKIPCFSLKCMDKDNELKNHEIERDPRPLSQASNSTMIQA